MEKHKNTIRQANILYATDLFTGSFSCRTTKSTCRVRSTSCVRMMADPQSNGFAYTFWHERWACLSCLLIPLDDKERIEHYRIKTPIPGWMLFPANHLCTGSPQSKQHVEHQSYVVLSKFQKSLQNIQFTLREKTIICVLLYRPRMETHRTIQECTVSDGNSMSTKGTEPLPSFLLSTNTNQ